VLSSILSCHGTGYIAPTLARMGAKMAHHQAQHDQHAIHAEQSMIHEAEHRNAIERYASPSAAGLPWAPASTYRLYVTAHAPTTSIV
jgi:hypothetical protein